MLILFGRKDTTHNVFEGLQISILTTHDSFGSKNRNRIVDHIHLRN